MRLIYAVIWFNCAYISDETFIFVYIIISFDIRCLEEEANNEQKFKTW